MSAKDVIRASLETSRLIVDSYLDGLTDTDILVRAVPGMNHIAWQLGHLIESEREMVELVKPGSAPALPEGFAEAHSKETTTNDDPTKFQSLDEYKALWKAQRDATDAILDATPESDYSRTDPSFPPYASSVGALLLMTANHPLMHAGQFVAVRRLLNKPISI